MVAGDGMRRRKACGTRRWTAASTVAAGVRAVRSSRWLVQTMDVELESAKRTGSKGVGDSDSSDRLERGADELGRELDRRPPPPELAGMHSGLKAIEHLLG